MIIYYALKKECLGIIWKECLGIIWKGSRAGQLPKKNTKRPEKSSPLFDASLSNAEKVFYLDRAEEDPEIMEDFLFSIKHPA